MQTALITGATSGIGWATAEVFAESGIRLILCGRRQERLDELSVQLSRLTEVTTLCFDVRNQKDVAHKINTLPDEWKFIDILLNNAGNAHGLGSIDNGNIEDWDAMIDINVKGLLYVSKAVIPQMVKRQIGDIINIGSIAGKEVYANGGVYCASKYAVDAINQGMRKDLFKHGIRVSAVNPGLVETEFSMVRFKGDKERADKVYDGFMPLQARDIAEIIYFAISRPRHVNIADLLVLPSAQASSTEVNRK